MEPQIGILGRAFYCPELLMSYGLFQWSPR